MKNFFYALFAALIISTTTSAQAPQIQWQKCLGGSGDEYGYDIHQTSDSGYIVAGTNASFGFGGYDAWVVKLSASGATQWQKRFGGSQDDMALSIEQTLDGSYMVAGSTSSNDTDVSYNHGGSDIWLVKLSPSGSIIWERTYGGSGADAVMTLHQTPDRGFIVAGYSTSSDGDITLNKGGYDMWVFKIDSAGSMQWQKTYGGTGNEFSTSIRILDNGYILAGYGSSTDGDITGSHGQDDIFVFRLSDTGAIVWKKTLGGSMHEFSEDIAITSDSSFVVVGGSNSTDGDIAGNKGHGDAWIVKLSASGAFLWQQCLGSSLDDAATSIRTTADGGYLLSGWVSANDGDVSGLHGSADFWLAKLTATGSITWQKPVGSYGNDVARSMQTTSDGGYIMTGYTTYNSGDVNGFHGGSDIWVVKLNHVANDVPSLATVRTITCAPNPTSDRLNIVGVTNAEISVHNLVGQLMKHAEHADAISIADLPTGIYTVTIASNGVIVYRGSVEKH